MVKSYARDLKTLLEEADVVRRKSFIKSFVKRIIVEGEHVKVEYGLPLPESEKVKSQGGVLTIDILGGAGGIRTPYLLTASQTFSRVNYGPSVHWRSIFGTFNKT